jgi:hypothetical protein
LPLFFSGIFCKAEADMRREELEKKKIKAEFASGGTQSGTVATAPKVNMPIPGVKRSHLLIQWVKLAFREYSFYFIF